MSYTSDVKQEIASSLEYYDEEKMMELYGILQSKNAIKDHRIVLSLENINVAKRAYTLTKELTKLKIGIRYTTSKKLGAHKVFTVFAEPQRGLAEFCEELHKMHDDMNEELTNSYVRGIFEATGYVKDPSSEYSLDFFLDNKNMAEELHGILQNMGLRAFITQKRNKYLVYLRTGEHILDVLVKCGAKKTFFHYEEVTMIKELKNKTVREMNCEVANETKSINTGKQQIDMINAISDKIGLKALPSVLEEACKARLMHPESSLQEIADFIGISKSGLRNRFRRIEEIYTGLNEDAKQQ